jgi:AI-2 transport protein TqsA
MNDYLSPHDPNDPETVGLEEPIPQPEDERPDSEQRRADRRVQTVCLLILTLIASGAALFLLRPVLVPFVLALFFAYCLTPLLDWQTRRWRIPQILAVFGTAILAAVLVVLLGLPLAVSADRMSQRFKERYEPQLKTMLGRADARLHLNRFGVRLSEQGNLIFPDDVRNLFLSSVPSEVTAFVSRGVLVIIFTIFILMGRTANRPNRSGVLDEIEARVQKYLSQLIFLSAVTGLLVTIILALLGVEFAAVFGFLAFLLNFIPTIGGIIATLLPLPVILLSPDMAITTKVLAVALPGGLQFILGNLVQPRVFGSALGLHPVVVLLALIFWGMIWGLAGAFLATPMTAVLRIVLERIPATKPLAELLKGNLSAVI